MMVLLPRFYDDNWYMVSKSKRFDIRWSHALLLQHYTLHAFVYFTNSRLVSIFDETILLVVHNFLGGGHIFIFICINIA